MSPTTNNSGCWAIERSPVTSAWPQPMIAAEDPDERMGCVGASVDSAFDRLPRSTRDDKGLAPCTDFLKIICPLDGCAKKAHPGWSAATDRPLRRAARFRDREKGATQLWQLWLTTLSQP